MVVGGGGVDCVIFAGKQESLFRSQEDSRESVNRGRYPELLSGLAEHDPDEHLCKCLLEPRGKHRMALHEVHVCRRA